MVLHQRCDRLEPPGGGGLPPAELATADEVQGREPGLLLRPLGLPQLRRCGAVGLRSPALADLPRCNGPPFADPAVGYVAAPSVCDANASESWSARGRLYAEATFHGAFQLGHSAGWSPLCIGSHYAVRTAALSDIGGIGPELAEDFATSFLLNTAGWHGAFAIDAEAHGDGPGTFAAMLVQEFQWSKSLTVVLLKLVPSNLRRLDWPHRLRFVYALCFYLLLVTSTVAGLLLAPVAAVTGKPWMNVNYLAFLVHWWSLSIWLIALAVFLRKRGLLRPQNAPIISWENWLYVLVRWPYIARGLCSAVFRVVRPRAETFKVTPKGSAGLSPFRRACSSPISCLVLAAPCPQSLANRRIMLSDMSSSASWVHSSIPWSPPGATAARTGNGYSSWSICWSRVAEDQHCADDHRDPLLAPGGICGYSLPGSSGACARTVEGHSFPIPVAFAVLRIPGLIRSWL